MTRGQRFFESQKWKETEECSHHPNWTAGGMAAGARALLNGGTLATLAFSTPTLCILKQHIAAHSPWLPAEGGWMNEGRREDAATNDDHSH